MFRCVVKSLIMILLYETISYTINKHKIKNIKNYLSTKKTNDLSINQHLFSVAPMMDYTNRFQRYLMRLLSLKAVLYTEMVTCNSIIERYKRNEVIKEMLTNGLIEEPIILQLGGADPIKMKEAAEIAVKYYNYKEINVNVGCPSERVSGSGCFGAKLMLSPELVSELCISIGEVTNRPATVKCRIGIDDFDSYDFLYNFIEIVSNKGQVNHFIIHARKAILNKNFSPADNRSIPPLNYNFVYQLKSDFPSLQFTINGGFNSLPDVNDQLDKGLYGVMVGRAVVNDPYHWRHIDTKIYNQQSDPGLTRREVISKYSVYASTIEKEEGLKVRNALIKPLHNIFYNEPYTKQFKVSLDRHIRDTSMSIEDVIVKSATGLSDSVLDKL